MINRRQVLQLGAGILALPAIPSLAESAAASPVITRSIPSSGEQVPVIGMGTSRTFDEKAKPEILDRLGAVMQAFIEGGGRIIDSSPMYGRAEARVGDVLRGLPDQPDMFAATKVWTSGEQKGITQMNESAQRMNVKRFDLIAVHNLKDWETQLRTLRTWKEEGRVRYIGITTSHGRHHDEFLDVMKTQPLDFVQFSYNIEDRVAEEKLLPLAADRGIATMINRPYQRGDLFDRVRDEPLPAVAGDIGCNSWGQFFLKFILAHPAVTSIIPATAKVHHMQDNMQANTGVVPDADQRREMLRAFKELS